MAQKAARVQKCHQLLASHAGDDIIFSNEKLFLLQETHKQRTTGFILIHWRIFHENNNDFKMYPESWFATLYQKKVSYLYFA
jgi:hypothetical protein